MNTVHPYAADITAILSHQHDNGGSLWATPDKRLLKGSPFSTLDLSLIHIFLGCGARKIFCWKTPA